MSNQSTHRSSRKDVYSETTAQLVAAIEASHGKPQLPWRKSKGALFMPVNFHKEFEAEPNPDDTGDDGKRRVARASSVFNASQVDGYEVNASPEPLGPVHRIAALDTFRAAFTPGFSS
jgi:antirestriction protein ArdC